MAAKNEMIVYWSVLSHGDWTLHLAASEAGLLFVGSANRGYEELAEWVNARLRHPILERNDEMLHPYLSELIEYLEGKRNVFSQPLVLHGTPFQSAVWSALQEIPYGETDSYSGIAARIGRPAAGRAVGAAIGANPILISVPCHRVIGKSGALTGYRGGMTMKTKLLELESSRSAGS